MIFLSYFFIIIILILDPHFKTINYFADKKKYQKNFNITNEIFKIKNQPLKLLHMFDQRLLKLLKQKKLLDIVLKNENQF